MKWLKSTTQKAWTAACNGKQVIIPQNETLDNRWLSLNDDEFAELTASAVIASLIKAGGITVLDEEPAELKNSVPALQVTNTQLRAENDTLKAQVKDLTAKLKNATGVDIEAIKAEAVEAVKADYEQKLADAQSKYEQLESEAKQALTDKDAEIAKLEKKLKKAGE